jgi:ligand-binding sensor domain-containing protein
MRLMTRLLRLFLLSLPLALASIPSAEGLSSDRGLTQALRRIWQFQQGLPDATILCVRQLGDGYLYLGTPTGLTRFDGLRFTKIDAVGNAWVEDVVADEAGDLWLATDGAGVIRLHKEQATTFGSEAGLSSLRVRQVLFDRNGALLACTAEGIERLSDGKFTRLPVGDAGRDVEAACVAADGKLWIGGKGARVVAWDGHAAAVRQLKTVPPTVSVRAILQGEDGVMWIGTTAGLVRLKGDEETRFTTKEGLADDWVYSLTQGANGVVWVGTRNGFSRVRSAGAGGPGSEGGIVIDSFQAQDGLSQSTVYSVC